MNTILLCGPDKEQAASAAGHIKGKIMKKIIVNSEVALNDSGQ